MVGYLSGVWHCRYFWLSLVRMDLRCRYRGSFLGVGWSLLPPISMLSLVPSLLLIGVLGWSMATLAGLANMYFQDAQHLMDIGFQVLFYLTPIMYDPKSLPGSGNLVHIMRYNPFVIFLDLLRG